MAKETFFHANATITANYFVGARFERDGSVSLSTHHTFLRRRSSNTEKASTWSQYFITMTPTICSTVYIIAGGTSKMNFQPWTYGQSLPLLWTQREKHRNNAKIKTELCIKWTNLHIQPSTRGIIIWIQFSNARKCEITNVNSMNFSQVDINTSQWECR